MKTLNDLNITNDEWKTIAGWTEDFNCRPYTHERYMGLLFENSSNRGIDKQQLQSFIYQAIDGAIEHKHIVLIGGDKIHFGFYEYGRRMAIYVKDISEYDNKTTARLAALQWIVQRVIGNIYQNPEVLEEDND